MKESLAKSNQHAALAISDPPNKVANDRLMSLFQNLGIAAPEQCDLASAINPLNGDCWTGSSSVVKYDVKKVRYTEDIQEPVTSFRELT